MQYRTEIAVDTVTQAVTIPHEGDLEDAVALAADIAVSKQRDTRRSCPGNIAGKTACAVVVRALEYNDAVAIQAICRGCHRPENVQQAALDTLETTKSELQIQATEVRRQETWSQFVASVEDEAGHKHDVIGYESFEWCTRKLPGQRKQSAREQLAMKALALVSTSITRPAAHKNRYGHMEASAHPYRDVPVFSSESIKEQTSSQSSRFIGITPNSVRLFRDAEYLSGIYGVGKLTLHLYRLVYEQLKAHGYSDVATNKRALRAARPIASATAAPHNPSYGHI